jgi:hypothetical protein
MGEAARKDSAEVVFVSCTHTSAFINMQGIYEVDGVPILDLFTGSLKLAETLLDIKKAYGTAVCKKSIYMAPSTGWEKLIPTVFS